MNPVLRCTLFGLALLPGLASGASMSYTSLVLFGDSVTDIGNSFAAAGVPDSAWYPQGRFLDDAGNDGVGDSYGEVLWRALNLPGELTASALGGTNFAFGGARSRYGSQDVSQPGREPPTAGTPSQGNPSFGSFLWQLDTYLSATGAVADPFALYMVMIGGNDVGDIAAELGRGDTANADALFAQSVADVVSGVVDLVVAGARNVAVASVPNLGITPEARALDAVAPGTAALLSGLSLSYNNTLAAGLDGALGLVGDLDFWFLDTYALVDEILADPGRFGLVNTTDACLVGFFVDGPDGSGIPPALCTDPTTFGFYDRVHPSSTVHAVLAERFYAAVPAPMPLVLLSFLLPAMLLRRQRHRRRPCS